MRLEHTTIRGGTSAQIKSFAWTIPYPLLLRRCVINVASLSGVVETLGEVQLSRAGTYIGLVYAGISATSNDVIAQAYVTERGNSSVSAPVVWEFGDGLAFETGSQLWIHAMSNNVDIYFTLQLQFSPIAQTIHSKSNTSY